MQKRPCAAEGSVRRAEAWAPATLRSSTGRHIPARRGEAIPTDVGAALVGCTRERLRDQGRRLATTVRRLSADDLAWRPNPAANSAGNLVIHVCGNLRQRIVCGLGAVPYARDRDGEFAAEGPWTPGELAAQAESTFSEVDRILAAVTPDRLGDAQTIRGQDTTVLEVLLRVVGHTGEHVGQVVYIAKALLGEAFEPLSIPRPGTR